MVDRDTGRCGVVDRAGGCGVVDRDVGVLPTPVDDRLLGVLFPTLVLVSDTAEVILVFESVFVRLRFDVRDGVVLFLFFVSTGVVLLRSTLFVLLVVPRM